MGHSHVGKGRCSVCGRFFRPFKVGDVVRVRKNSWGIWTGPDILTRGIPVLAGWTGVVKYEGGNTTKNSMNIVVFDSEGTSSLLDTLLDTDIDLVQGA